MSKKRNPQRWPPPPEHPGKQPYHHGKHEPWIQREGKLGGPGYTDRSASERHKLLAHSVRVYGYRSTLGSLQVLLRGHAEHASTRKVIKADVAWLEGKYSPRENPNALQHRISARRMRAKAEAAAAAGDPYTLQFYRGAEAAHEGDPRANPRGHWWGVRQANGAWVRDHDGPPKAFRTKRAAEAYVRSARRYYPGMYPEQLLPGGPQFASGSAAEQSYNTRKNPSLRDSDPWRAETRRSPRAPSRTFTPDELARMEAAVADRNRMDAAWLAAGGDPNSPIWRAMQAEVDAQYAATGLEPPPPGRGARRNPTSADEQWHKTLRRDDSARRRVALKALDTPATVGHVIHVFSQHNLGRRDSRGRPTGQNAAELAMSVVGTLASEGKIKRVGWMAGDPVYVRA